MKNISDWLRDLILKKSEKHKDKPLYLDDLLITDLENERVFLTKKRDLVIDDIRQLDQAKREVFNKSTESNDPTKERIYAKEYLTLDRKICQNDRLLAEVIERLSISESLIQLKDMENDERFALVKKLVLQDLIELIKKPPVYQNEKDENQNESDIQEIMNAMNQANDTQSTKKIANL